MYYEIFFRCARTLLPAYKVIHKETTERITVCVQIVPLSREKLRDFSTFFLPSKDECKYSRTAFISEMIERMKNPNEEILYMRTTP